MDAVSQVVVNQGIFPLSSKTFSSPNFIPSFLRAIRSNVGRLAELARGQVRLKSNGRVREYFIMLHR
jgi:hypothetical protein